MSYPLIRRATLWALCGRAIASCTLAWAQPRTVHLVVPYGSGAVQDTIARTFSQELGQALGATVVVENKPGAGGTVGTAPPIVTRKFHALERAVLDGVTGALGQCF